MLRQMFKIVGEKFTPLEFEEYLKRRISPQAWVKRIVLHNTAIPSIKQRPGGILTANHISNLHTYYAKNQKWSGGPHLFIDAQGIWVFNPLMVPGVHSPSYNSSSWGVEMLGDFESENPNEGLGKQIVENTQLAVAALAKVQGWSDVDNQRLILHREDPRTTHKCPGKNISKLNFIEEVNKKLISDSKSPMLVVKGSLTTSAFFKDGKICCSVRTIAEALGAKVEYDAKTNVVTVIPRTFST
jgi:hypothetical protein